MLHFFKRAAASVGAAAAGKVRFFVDDSGMPKAKDELGILLDFVGPQGDTGPTGATGPSFIMASFQGALVPTIGNSRWYPPAAVVLTNLFMAVGTAPTATLVVDILKNGVSIFTEAKPQIVAGSNTSTTAVQNIQMTTTDYLALSVVSGSGSDLSLRIDYQ